MKVVIDPELKGAELFEFLKTNKSSLLAQKKYETKKGDSISYAKMIVDEKGEAVKANIPLADTDPNVIQVLSVINTTNILDSHGDVHIPGLWKKSLAENKELYLLEEHKMSFRGIISDKVKAFTKTMSWKSLGLDAEGKTEALIFDSTISKNRNEYMFGEYKNGHVKNHSVGMRYVKIDLAINAPDDKYYKEEYEIWLKHIDLIVNKEDAENAGFFWAVTEAKVIEGSAVPVGSNRITPTQEVKTDTEFQPPVGTEEQPSEKSTFEIKTLLNIFN